ncbi:MAG: ABC transporter ATP-binding protein [Candidatus Methanoplasma sp.]|jgi:NitT/TauT family transport system ATP-binding protein|nr:ABC transporter ATP-binding protein [Candidatus Methanoplasma sp.]
MTDHGKDDTGTRILIDGLGKTYRRDGKDTEAIEDISLEIRQGELVSFIGPSGCGKTTLLKLIAGLIPPTGGTVEIDGRSCTTPGADRGMVFQDFALLPWRSVRKNVELGLEIAGVPKAERRERAENYIKLVGLEKFADSKVYELSGGMKQRVAIARSLVVRPDVVLMDEPFGALDAQTRNIMQAQLIDILGSTDQTIIFITHSVDEAIYLSDRIVVLTKRPTTIREIIDIPWERPRDRSAPEFNVLKKRILDYLEKENVMEN